MEIGNPLSLSPLILLIEPQQDQLLTCSQIPFDKKCFNHTSTLYKHYIIIFGGMQESGIYSNDITVLNLKNNQIIKPYLDGPTPEARYAHSACLFSGNQIIIFGGQSAQGVLNETAIMTIRSEEPFIIEWKVKETQGEQQFFRASHSAHICNNKMYVFGGWDKIGQSSKQLWSLDLENYNWEQLELKKDITEGLWDHCSVLYRDKILVFGGYSDFQGTRTNDFWILSTDKLEWERISPIGIVPPPRQGTAMVQLNEKIYLFGGRTTQEYTNDLFSYDFEAKSWHQIETKGDIPSTRRYHTLNSFENKLIVIGGQYIDQKPLNIFSIPISEKIEILEKTEVFKSKKWNSILETLYQEKNFSDVTFLVEEQSIPAHKAILSAGCKFFDGMFKSGMQESQAETIKIPDMKAITFNALLQFIYCNEVELDEGLALDLLEISNRFSIGDLREGCEEFLRKRINEDNYVTLAKVSDLLDLKILRNGISNFIIRNLHKIIKREDVNNLPNSIYVQFMEYVSQKNL